MGNERSKVTYNTILIIAQSFYFYFYFFWVNSCLSRFYKSVLKSPILIRWNKLKFFVEKVLFTCCFPVCFFFSFFFTNNANGGPLLHCCLLFSYLLNQVKVNVEKIFNPFTFCIVWSDVFLSLYFSFQITILQTRSFSRIYKYSILQNLMYLTFHISVNNFSCNPLLYYWLFNFCNVYIMLFNFCTFLALIGIHSHSHILQAWGLNLTVF